MTAHVAIARSSTVAGPGALGRLGIAPAPLPTEPREALVLATVRFIGAAYETGDSACWEAAHAHAEAALGRETVRSGEVAPGAGDAALLVARAAALFRVIRVDRPDFGVLPPGCRWMSADEAALLSLVRAARGGIGSGGSALALSRCAAAILDAAGAIRLLAAAASALAAATERVAADQHRSKLQDETGSKERAD